LLVLPAIYALRSGRAGESEPPPAIETMAA